jgi:membrane protease YdiL (CAAX protease family)
MAPKQIKVNAFGIAILTACFFYIAEIFAGKLVTKGTESLLFIGIVRAIEIVLFIRIVGLNALGLEKDRFFPGIIRGLVWSFAFGLLVIIIAEGFWLSSGKNFLRLFRSELPENSIERVLFFCIGGWIAPVAEEIFFRGIIYGFFRRWGVLAAILLSTAIFFVAHTKAGLPQWVGGILFAIAYESEGNLMTPIVIHCLGNMAIFMVYFLI